MSHDVYRQVEEKFDEQQHRKNSSMSKCLLADLPPEILQLILSHLECPALVSLSRASKMLAENANNDKLWENLLRRYLPIMPTTPYPSETWRGLYVSHHPTWFLCKQRLWFADIAHTGKLIMVRFDPRRGCIEGHQLVAQRATPTFYPWAYKQDVIIHNFSPRIGLHTDSPEIKLDQYDPATTSKLNGSTERRSSQSSGRQGWWDGEVKMRLASGISTTFFLSKDIPPEYDRLSMEVWPPRIIPDMPRVRAVSQDNFQGWGHKPQSHKEISQTTFRLRHWTQFNMMNVQFGVRMGEEVSTWSSIDPKLYTPTKEKPYQGIFVGDFAGHGCEFILVRQTDRAPALDRGRVDLDSPFYRAYLHPNHVTDVRNEVANNPVLRRASSREDQVDDSDDHDDDLRGAQSSHSRTTSRFYPRRTAPANPVANLINSFLAQTQPATTTPRASLNAPFYTAPSHFHNPHISAQLPIEDRTGGDTETWSGAIEAIKLTGDPNVPRGEHTFIADDIGEAGFVRIAQEEPFKGARVVRSRGHVAGRGFSNGK